MNNFNAGAAIVAVLLSGCASSPNRIQSAYVSPNTYKSYSCQQINTELAAVDQKAVKLHKRLRNRADNDALSMTTGLILLWPALLFLSGGDGAEANEYARLKGMKEALQAAKPNCSATPLTDAAAAASVAAATPKPNGKVQILRGETPSGYCIFVPTGMAYPVDIGPPTAERPLCPSQL